MVDLETLGLDRDAVVLSIGAVICDANWLTLSSFTANLDVPEQLIAGRTITKSTQDWWSEQSTMTINKATRLPQSVSTELKRFKQWLQPYDNVFYWGNTPEFDLGKLNSLFKQYNFEPLDPYRWRCFKTARDLLATPEQLNEFRGNTTHEAIDDAIKQATLMRVTARPTPGLLTQKKKSYATTSTIRGLPCSAEQRS